MAPIESLGRKSGPCCISRGARGYEGVAAQELWVAREWLRRNGGLHGSGGAGMVGYAGVAAQGLWVTPEWLRRNGGLHRSGCTRIVGHTGGAAHE